MKKISLQDPPPRVRRGDALLKDYNGMIAAMGTVVDAVSGLPSHQTAYNVKLKSIYMSEAVMLIGGGMLGTRRIGEVIQWPAYYIDYL